MHRYEEMTTADWIESIAYAAVFIGVVAAGAILLLPDWPLVWGVLIAVGTVWLVVWSAQISAYRCPKYGHEFEVSLLTEVISPHGVGRNREGRWYGWKYLKCPQCKQWSRATLLRRSE